MLIRLSVKTLLSLCAVAALTFLVTPEVNAQRGFRIGNIMQAGGGQGFRLGGARAGMHFGGGQGASIGTQNFGMRFGNGQGARFGGQQYGMQFGGQQGTQIGQFATRPSVAPGTYYYGDSQRGYAQQPQAGVRQSARYVQPNIQTQTGVYPQTNNYAASGVYSQPPTSGSTAMIPTVAQPNGRVMQTQANVELNSQLEIAPPAQSGNGTQLDIAAAASMEPSTSTTESTATPATATPESTTVINETSNKVAPGIIRLRHPAEASEKMKYMVNGTAFELSPGESVMMPTGTEWTINFSAGETFGQREAMLSEAGTYSFEKSAEEGWVLVDDQPTETKIEEVPMTEEVGGITDSPAEETVPESSQPEPENAPSLTAPESTAPESTGVQLDAPAINDDGSSVLNTEVTTEPAISPTEIAPPKSPENKDN